MQSSDLLNLEDGRRSGWVQSIGLLDLEDGRRRDWVESIGPLNLEDGRRSDWVQSIGILNLEDGRRSDWAQSIGMLNLEDGSWLWIIPTMKIAWYQRGLLDVACKMQEKRFRAQTIMGLELIERRASLL